MREEDSVAVVGGGVAGLTAACYLARAGRTVTLFEKASQLGGRASSRQRQGFIFNRGIHALYTGGAATEAFAELGVTYRGGSPRNVWGLYRGQLYLSPATPWALLGSRLFSPTDKLELARVLGGLTRFDAAQLRSVSVQAWLEGNAKRPRVRAFLAAQARTLTYTAALDLVSAEVFVGKLQRLLRHPVVYLDGGWGTLVESLRQAAKGAGAQLVCGSGVAAVENDGGRVRGVRLRDGQWIKARAVVLAVPPQEAARLVDHPALRARVEATTPVRVACLNVALNHLPNPKYGVVQDLEQPLFMSVQSLASAVVPTGGALVYAFKQLDPREEGDARTDERELEGLLDAAQPGWRAAVVTKQFLPRIEAVGDLPAAHRGGFSGRASVSVPELGNIFLAGDWVGPEGFLVDASVASARTAARAVLHGSAEDERTPAEASGSFVPTDSAGEFSSRAAARGRASDRGQR